jgi:hypothetical protein
MMLNCRIDEPVTLIPQVPEAPTPVLLTPMFYRLKNSFQAPNCSLLFIINFTGSPPHL